MIGLTGVYTGSVMTSLGLVVRKIKQQSVFSYYWVKDAIDAAVKESAERKLLLFEDSLRRSALPSIAQSTTTSNTTTSSSSSSSSSSNSVSAGMNNVASSEGGESQILQSGLSISRMHRMNGVTAAAGLAKGTDKLTVLPNIIEVQHHELRQGQGQNQGQEQGQGQGQGQERRRRFGVTEVQEQLFKKKNVLQESSVIEEDEENQDEELEMDLTSRKSSDSGTLTSYLQAAIDFTLFCFVLFYFILFYFILFYFILFYFILFYFILLLCSFFLIIILHYCK